MLKIKVLNNEYKLKFGYKSFKKTKILKEVMDIRKKLYTPGENDEEDTEEKGMEYLDEILDLTSKLVLAALQKYHEEFRTDYGDSDSIKKSIEKVDDLIDSYMDEEDSMSIMELFDSLVEQLFSDGFLSKKSEVPNKLKEDQEEVVIPMKEKEEN